MVGESIWEIHEKHGLEVAKKSLSKVLTNLKKLHKAKYILGDVNLTRLYYDMATKKVTNTSWNYLKIDFKDEMVSRTFPIPYWKHLNQP